MTRETARVLAILQSCRNAIDAQAAMITALQATVARWEAQYGPLPEDKESTMLRYAMSPDPDHTLPTDPDRPGHPDHGLPGDRPDRPGHPDHELPGRHRPGHPDQGLPGDKPATPDHDLPPGAKPKR